MTGVERFFELAGVTAVTVVVLVAAFVGVATLTSRLRTGTWWWDET